MSDSTDLVDWVLNGEPVQSPAGTTILEAAKTAGVELPSFCYHPGLSIAGNCRICLVETNRSPKPAISCSERISPGLEVQTHSPMALEAREGVMEFQLINHPLDCPVCDKAGECTLQDHSYSHGPDRSRFVEPKNIRHTKELGPSITIWGNRCIVCTRCVRFCDEISGTGELCVVSRGDRSVVDVFPGIPIDNPLAGNTVDICPVGALISHDFMFQSRVWNVERTDTVCAGCSKGCNVEVETNSGFIKRLLPRENPDVNEWWMCDYGRFDYRYVHADDRVRTPRSGVEAIDPTHAEERAAELVQAAGAGKVAFVVDPFMTCEEYHLVSRLAERTESNHIAGWLPPEGTEESFPGNFTISAEKCPNRVGAEMVLGPEVFGLDQKKLVSALNSGDIDLVLVFAGFPAGDPPDDVVSSLAKAKSRIVFTLFDGAWTDGADLVLPAASPFEKDGTYVNQDRIAQRVRSKDRPDAAFRAQPGLETASIVAPWIEHEAARLQRWLLALGGEGRSLSSAGLFRQLADRVPAFANLSHRELGQRGQPLTGTTAAADGGQS